jgi:GntR family transcriptional regulator, transcriptional repressor for pyruvate dehydrogenase complex
VDAAYRASAEQVRSLRVLVAEMPAQEESDPWASLAAATYSGIAEASGNVIFGSLTYDLLQGLACSGDRWDVAARLWTVRRWAERSLHAVVAEIADGEPDRARRAMQRHLGGAISALGV